MSEGIPSEKGSGNKKRVAVVLSGAVARGAFQAGALGRILTRLEEQFGDEYRPSILVGTSAGAINAVLWADRADLAAAVADKEIQGVWSQMGVDDVYAHLSSLGSRLGGPAFRGFVHGGGGGPTSLLDTEPLKQTAARELPDPLELKAGMDAVGVVSTWVPPSSGASVSGRSVLFLQARGRVTWQGSSRRALDVERGPLRPEHVLASSTVPGGFPAQWVGSGSRQGWYTDGGVRLNAPLKPAIALGATHIIFVSAMSLQYAPYVPPAVQPQPALIDAASQVMHALTADRAIEDLKALSKTNRLVHQAKAKGVTLHNREGTALREVPFMAVGPEPGELGWLADSVLGPRPWTRLIADVVGPLFGRRTANEMVGRSLRSAGAGPGQRELLSYLLFDETYFRQSAQRGVHAADKALANGWRSQF